MPGETDPDSCLREKERPGAGRSECPLSSRLFLDSQARLHPSAQRTPDRREREWVAMYCGIGSETYNHEIVSHVQCNDVIVEEVVLWHSL